MRRLSEPEFVATMGRPMQPRGADACAPFDFGTYFDGLPASAFEGHDFSGGEVESVYAEPSRRYEHVLVRCAQREIFFMLVLDLVKADVLGHRLLNLRVAYGSTTDAMHADCVRSRRLRPTTSAGCRRTACES